jgi:hypothetical protein
MFAFNSNELYGKGWNFFLLKKHGSLLGVYLLQMRNLKVDSLGPEVIESDGILFGTGEAI